MPSYKRVVEGIGGTFPPVVISDRSNGDFEFDHLSLPDYIYNKERKIRIICRIISVYW